MSDRYTPETIDIKWLEKHDREIQAQALREAIQKYGFTMPDTYGDMVEVVFQEDLTDDIAARLTTTTEEPT